MDSICSQKKKKKALRKLHGLKNKPMAAARLIHLLTNVKRTYCKQFLMRLKEESCENQTNELFHKMDQSLQ